MPMSEELKVLLERTKGHVMSPAEIQAQRESWGRGMAPCEHGVADFEDCCQCRGGHSFVEHPCPDPGQEGKEFCELCGVPKP
jgi:hypothetical protein